MSNLNTEEITEYINEIEDEKIQESLVKFIKQISALSQDKNNHNQILDWINDINMNKYITHENIKYVRSFYMFLASMPPVPIKDKVQEFIELAGKQ